MSASTPDSGTPNGAGQLVTRGGVKYFCRWNPTLVEAAIARRAIERERQRLGAGG